MTKNAPSISRRTLLKVGSVGSVACVAGCLDSSDEESDTEPPEVETAESEAYQRGDGLSEEARSREISVETNQFEDPSIGFEKPLSHVTSYSYEAINVRIDSRSPELEHLQDDSEYVVEALAYEYLTDDVVASGESGAFTIDSLGQGTDLTVDIEFYDEVLGKRVAYFLFYRLEIAPDYRMSDMVAPATLFTATNPFEVSEDGITPAPSDDEQDSDTIDYADLTTEEQHPSTGSYTRHNVEGGYHVSFSPETPPMVPDISTKVPFYIPKLIYDTWTDGERPSQPESPADRTKYVTESLEEGIGAHVAEVVEMSALTHGAISDEAMLDYFSTFVQSLPYALDPISTGYRDYSRYPAETLVDARGDCVDTSILLITALLGSSLDCEAGFFSFDPAATDEDAGHLAVAVSPDTVSLNGPVYRHSGREYYYIEPTGFFAPGEVPEGIDFESGAFHPIDKPNLD